ncbi:unnamed protein product [Gongylonema pulchrum]|uniref:Doublecortin domain-containing protein n=1 Tax=Gongylonema pulchrum TaxID=637853 RepID=A0A183DAI1_9BILA|nr:unnamed protein product [Gongylonema pulchrum]
MDILFCETVQVPPTKYRPIRIFKGDKFENPQSVNLRKVLEASETIRAIRLALTGNNDKSLLVSLVKQKILVSLVKQKILVFFKKKYVFF